MEDTFEFDAPKYHNFDRTPYRLRKQIIEALLDNNAPQTDDVCTSVANGLLSSEISEQEHDIDWFQQAHKTHEPSVPPTPPAPLITPSLGRVGLGSPGRVIKSSSSNAPSSSATEPPVSSINTRRERHNLLINANQPTKWRRLRNSSIKSPLRTKFGLNDLQLIADECIHEDEDEDAGTNTMDRQSTRSMDLLRSPEPPQLAHQLSSPNIPRTTIVSREPYSRRQSANLSDFDLTDLIPTQHDDRPRQEQNFLNHREDDTEELPDEIVAISSRITTMRPYSLTQSNPESLNASPNARKRVKVAAPLCRAPTTKAAVGMMRKTQPSEADIKRLLSEHNRRVRPRR